MGNTQIEKECRRIVGAAVMAILGFAAAPASAAEGYLRAGAAALFWNPSMTVHAGGATVPGAEASMDANFTLALEIGVFPFSGHGLLDNLAFSVALGLPPKATVVGAGSLASAGTLAKSTFGPAAVTAHYHLRDLPYVKPYLGVGLAYAFSFGNDDGAMKEVSVDPAFGAVFQGGVDVPLGGRWGVYADAMYVLLSTKVTGVFDGMSTSTDMTLNPVVVTAGASARF